MPIILAIGTFLTGIISSALAFEATSTAAKVATRLVVIGIIITLFLAIMASIIAIVNSLSSIAPNCIVVAYSWFVPTNFIPCLTAIATVQVMIWAWHWKKYSIDFVSQGVG